MQMSCSGYGASHLMSQCASFDKIYFAIYTLQLHVIKSKKYKHRQVGSRIYFA